MTPSTEVLNLEHEATWTSEILSNYFLTCILPSDRILKGVFRWNDQQYDRAIKAAHRALIYVGHERKRSLKHFDTIRLSAERHLKSRHYSLLVPPHLQLHGLERVPWLSYDLVNSEHRWIDNKRVPSIYQALLHAAWSKKEKPGTSPTIRTSDRAESMESDMNIFELTESMRSVTPASLDTFEPPHGLDDVVIDSDPSLAISSKRKRGSDLLMSRKKQLIKPQLRDCSLSIGEVYRQEDTLSISRYRVPLKCFTSTQASAQEIVDFDAIKSDLAREHSGYGLFGFEHSSGFVVLLSSRLRFLGYLDEYLEHIASQQTTDGGGDAYRSPMIVLFHAADEKDVAMIPETLRFPHLYDRPTVQFSTKNDESAARTVLWNGDQPHHSNS